MFHKIHIFKHQIPGNFWIKSGVLPQCDHKIVYLQILPHEMPHYKGGKELLSEIELMTSKVSTFRAQQKLEEQNQQKASGTSGNLVHHEIQPTSEIKGLLSSPSHLKNGVKKQEGLNVKLEAGILSINDPKFDERDKSLNTDLD